MKKETKPKRDKPLSTAAQVRFLQSRLPVIAHKWRKVHTKNIVAFRIDYKVTEGKETPNYCIVIQVASKKPKKNLKKEQVLPEFIRIKFPDGKFRKVPTDVVETGHFEFQFGITDEVDSIRSPHFGTAGLFVTDSTNRVFVLTNYHVVAERLINQGVFYFRREPGDNRRDVRLVSAGGSIIEGMFAEGILNHGVDAAFVFLPIPPNNNLNRLPDGGIVRGKLDVRPIPDSFRNRPVVVYSHFHPRGITSIINDNSAVLFTNDPAIFFEDVIQLKPRVTDGGDSGSIVLTPSGAVLGIIVGADQNDHSYVIPFFKINDFKNVFIP